MLRISELRQGQLGTVRQVLGTGAVRQRLLDMGMLPSSRVVVERTALTGDPVWVVLNRTHLALRRQEADSVLVSEG